MIGGPAFPSHGSMGEVTHEGMSVRDYFAAHAMQGELASQTADGGAWYDTDKLAQYAYEIADSMLKARGNA